MYLFRADRTSLADIRSFSIIKKFCNKVKSKVFFGTYNLAVSSLFAKCVFEWMFL